MPELNPVELVGLGVVAGMAVLTYLTRAGGVMAMAFVPMTPKAESFLRHLAGSVIVAVLIGAAHRGDAPLRTGLAASLAIMALTRSPFAAILTGIGATAGCRALGW